VLSSFFSFGCFLRLAAGLFWLRFVLVIDLFVADCILFSAFSLSVWSGNIWFSCCLRLEWSQRLCWNSFAAGGSVVGGDLVPPCGRSCCRLQWIVHLAPVVQTLDGAVHWINHYPLDNSIGFASVYPLDSDLSVGRRYPSFEQLGPGLTRGRGRYWSPTGQEFLVANSFKTVSDLRLLVRLVSREVILFLSWLKPSVFWRAGCEEGMMSSSESERVHFCGDLIGESVDEVWLSSISARISATISTSLLALAMFARPVSEFVVDSFVSCVL